ncbi:hypothetical protein LIER_20224 [Lithospermum erythrorhizon]|uniref:Secreted protein n=1 Tax=Lithospermum erythrorhizon TaxID=34254 RepID=A0AAV3QKN4_LITER
MAVFFVILTVLVKMHFVLGGLLLWRSGQNPLILDLMNMFPMVALRRGGVKYSIFPYFASFFFSSSWRRKKALLRGRSALQYPLSGARIMSTVFRLFVLGLLRHFSSIGCLSCPISSLFADPSIRMYL